MGYWIYKKYLKNHWTFYFEFDIQKFSLGWDLDFRGKLYDIYFLFFTIEVSKYK